MATGVRLEIGVENLPLLAKRSCRKRQVGLGARRVEGVQAMLALKNRCRAREPIAGETCRNNARVRGPARVQPLGPGTI